PAPNLIEEPAASAPFRVTASLPAPVSTATLAAPSCSVSLPEPVLTLPTAVLIVPRVRAPDAAEPSILVTVAAVPPTKVRAAEPAIVRDLAAVKPATSNEFLLPAELMVREVAVVLLTSAP